MAKVIIPGRHLLTACQIVIPVNPTTAQYSVPVEKGHPLARCDGALRLIELNSKTALPVGIHYRPCRSMPVPYLRFASKGERWRCPVNPGWIRRDQSRRLDIARIVTERNTAGVLIYSGYISPASDRNTQALSLPDRIEVNSLVPTKLLSSRIDNIPRTSGNPKSDPQSLREAATLDDEARVLTLATVCALQAHL